MGFKRHMKLCLCQLAIFAVTGANIIYDIDHRLFALLPLAGFDQIFLKLSGREHITLFRDHL